MRRCRNNAPPRIVATGRGDWLGWVELTIEPVDETSTRMTAKVIEELAPDMLCVVEAENRPALARFNDELLGGRFAHCMLVYGNDPRGIDVHVRHLREKLETKPDRPELVITVRGAGYRLAS